MAYKWDHSPEGRITSKMQELIASVCVVTFKEEGNRRGIIERIESLAMGRGFVADLREFSTTPWLQVQAAVEVFGVPTAVRGLAGPIHLGNLR